MRLRHLDREQRPSVLLATGLAIVLGLLPVGLYSSLLGRAPQVHPAEAIAWLDARDEERVLVDVRPDADYQERHIFGAQWLPLARILELNSAGALPAALRDKTLLLVCAAGIDSAAAARHLAQLDIEAYSVRGGMLDWGRAWPQFSHSPYSRFERAGGVLEEPFRAMSPGEQAAAALAMLWIKPTYMLLSGIVAYFLLRHSQSADLKVLGWGLLVFLVGEVFCAINYLFLKDNSYFAEYMHSYSMAVAFSLAAYALMEGLDQRLVHFSQADKRCAMLPVCGPCARYQTVRCGVRRLAQLLSVSLIILSLIPLLSPFGETAYSTRIAGFDHYYVRPIVHQWFEARYSPAVSILLIALALLVLLLTPRTALPPLARVLFCAGAGFFGFATFRVMLGMIFSEALAWATFWEELTELMFVGAVIYVLIVFRQTLLPDFKFPPGQMSRNCT